MRRLAVSGVSADDEEIVCRVKVPNRVVPHAVLLYPEDEEWDCDCETRAPVCEHVAAAVIAVNKARTQGDELPKGRSTEAKLVYRFSRHRGELKLERILTKADGSEEPLKTSLASAVARQSQGELSPSQEDLNVDRVLDQNSGSVLHRDRCASVIKLLASAHNVELDGQPVRISTEILKPQCVVRDAKTSSGKAAFEVQITRDPRTTDVLASGVALAKDPDGNQAIHLLGETEVTGLQLENLPSTKLYGPKDISTLVTEVLPELEKRFSLDVQTKKLPELKKDVRPRVTLEVEQVGDGLSVLAKLVYGDPPMARIDSGRLVHLQGPIPVRNEAAEQRVIQRAKDQLGLLPGSRISVSGPAATEMANRLDGWEGDVQGARGGRFIHHVRLAPKLESPPSGSGLELSFAGQTNDGQAISADATAVMRAFDEGHHLVPLTGGGWAELPADFLAQHGDKVAEILAARDPSNAEQPLKSFALPALAELCQALDYPAPPELQALRSLIDDFEHIPAAELPADLRADLRHYQRTGVNWLSFMRKTQMGATLADDMGLGKTLQALCIIEGRTLVVCPTSVVFNWAAELERFRPDLSFNIYHGPKRELDLEASVTLTSYALLRLDSEQLSAIEWEAVILDEAQTIKNPESQVTQAAYALRSKFRVTLSGTPIENRLDELWSQFHFTNPGLLGGRSEFQERYADPIRDGRAGAAERLRRKIRPFLLRRDKRAVAPELPPRTDAVLYCDLSDSERQLYDAINATTKKEVVERLRAGGNVMQALEALLRLRQAACHPSLVPGGQPTPDGGSAKTERLLRALELAQADGHKSLVFSQWTSFLDLLEPELQAQGIRFNRLDGSTKDRQAVVDAFQDPTGPEVMLLSLKAGGTGLNLTAADHVFLMDLWWNPAVEQQAMDRAHRIGQESPVFVYRLVSKGTVEERILTLQEQKRAVADAALEGGEMAASLSRDDLLALLE